MLSNYFIKMFPDNCQIVGVQLCMWMGHTYKMSASPELVAQRRSQKCVLREEVPTLCSKIKSTKMSYWPMYFYQYSFLGDEKFYTA